MRFLNRILCTQLCNVQCFVDAETKRIFFFRDRKADGIILIHYLILSPVWRRNSTGIADGSDNSSRQFQPIEGMAGSLFVTLHREVIFDNNLTGCAINSRYLTPMTSSVAQFPLVMKRGQHLHPKVIVHGHDTSYTECY